MAIKASLYSLTPLISAGYRFSLAALLIYIFVRIKNVPIVKDRIAIRIYVALGFFSFVIPFGLVYWGEQFVPSGLAAVLFAVYPFFVALFSHFSMPEDKIGSWRIAGMVVAFTGIIVIFSDTFTGSITAYTYGMGGIFISAVMQAGMAVTVKKHGGNLNPLSLNLFPMLIAGISFLLLGYLFEDSSKLVFDTNAFVSVGYLAFFGSLITFTAWYWLMKRINIVMLSLMTFITPIIALLLGYIIFNEILTSRHYAGCFLVLFGIILTNFRNLKKLRTEKIVQDTV
jgi:drug/metabolite transporter (DMT)-like permease